MRFAELLFFAYRDFTSDPDAILADIGYGRAHHRVLHFVNRQPGLRVADLLKILKITKQSLGRVLKQLIDDGYIRQQAGESDRRERLLFSTEKGVDLAAHLARPQLERISHAINAADGEEKKTIQRFLRHMISEDERLYVADLVIRHRDRKG
ncbi:MAG: MarR family winged helix-turn-helix transcriptional regulator [Methyloligellaceae bacterium]